jgi:tetraacyldisaccharide 4'-kinase
MINEWVLKILLSPLALLYGVGVAIRNGLYAVGLLRGVKFSVPVISIGNLSVGGAGKTPHTEYIIRLLHEYIYVSVVSRGYKRKTSGYIEVGLQHQAHQVGDEPLQFKRKFPHIPVVVAESRSLAIPQMVRKYPGLQLVLLDDGYQHREVVPGLNIMLTEYSRLYTRDWLLPVGRLREWRSEAKRADVIVVTKCPPILSQEERNAIEREVKRRTGQQIFFSRYIYGHPYRMYSQVGERQPLHAHLDVLLVAGIAGTEYLMEYVSEQCYDVRLLEYNDHHPFSDFDVRDIERHFQVMSDERQKIILTTEKDAMRLDIHREWILSRQLPIYILPVAVQFIDGPGFDECIKNWLLNFKR